MRAALSFQHSLIDWLLHLIVASTVWHLVGRAVGSHPVVAALVGGAALVAVAVLRWQRGTAR